MKSFKEYMEEKTYKVKSNYKDKLADISVKARREKIGDTAHNEKLSGLGLSRSGYADYLKGEKQRSLEEQRTRAKREIYEAEANAYSGYAEYLNNYNTVQEALNKKFIDGLITDGVFDIDAAERIAIDAGIPKERARETAELGVLISRNRAVAAAAKYAKSKNYSYNGAKYYALSLGLNDFDAIRVAEQVSRITEEEAEHYESLDKESYFDEIKNSRNQD